MESVYRSQAYESRDRYSENEFHNEEFGDLDRRTTKDDKRRRQEIDHNFKVVIRIRPPLPRYL